MSLADRVLVSRPACCQCTKASAYEEGAPRRREEERAARVQRAREYQAPAWAEPGADAGVGSDDGDASADAAYDVADELYCVACDKLFRSANAMANHERWAASSFGATRGLSGSAHMCMACRMVA